MRCQRRSQRCTGACWALWPRNTISTSSRRYLLGTVCLDQGDAEVDNTQVAINDDDLINTMITVRMRLPMPRPISIPPPPTPHPRYIQGPSLFRCWHCAGTPAIRIISLSMSFSQPMHKKGRGWKKQHQTHSTRPLLHSAHQDLRTLL